MTTIIDGALGVDVVQDGAISAAKLASGSVTAAKLSGGQTGTAPVFGCRAWCTFNGTLTGTNAPLSGGNVTSVTRTATGNYTVNFTTAMQDVNYATTLGAQGPSGASFTGQGLVSIIPDTTPTVSSIQIATSNSINATYADFARVSVAIFR